MLVEYDIEMILGIGMENCIGLVWRVAFSLGRNGIG